MLTTNVPILSYPLRSRATASGIPVAPPVLQVGAQICHVPNKLLWSVFLTLKRQFVGHTATTSPLSRIAVPQGLAGRDQSTNAGLRSSFDPMVRSKGQTRAMSAWFRCGIDVSSTVEGADPQGPPQPLLKSAGTHPHVHARMHTRTHARTHGRARAHTPGHDQL